MNRKPLEIRVNTRDCDGPLATEDVDALAALLKVAQGSEGHTERAAAC